MFRRWKQRQSRKRIETRFAAVVIIGMRAARDFGTRSGAVHLMVVDEASALAHTELMGRLAGQSGIAVGRLSSDDSDDVRAAAYQADVVIGTVDDFVADFGRETELGFTRNDVLVEGGPGATADELLSRYRRVGAA